MDCSVKLFLGFIFFYTFLVFAEANDIKTRYWKVTVADLENDICPIDSNANAYYIFDEGISEMRYEGEFVLNHKRHFRMKILDESALDKALIKVMLYNDELLKEELNSIKAVTYSLENGKVKKRKLLPKMIQSEFVSSQWEEITFTMPNVKKGSIIEVEYKVKSDFYSNFNGWNFQHEIPVLRSHLSVEVPEYFKYMEFRTSDIFYTSKASKSFGALENRYGALDYITIIYEYEARNIPAFIKDEFMSSEKNLIPNVRFDLFSIELFSQSNFYMRRWNDVRIKLMESDFFGGRLNNDKALKIIADSILSLKQGAQEQMYDALKFVQSSTVWNGNCSVLSEQTFFSTLSNMPGNSADINLALVALLQNLGLKAFPVVLSTRENGLLYDSQPLLSKLNYVIAACLIDNQHYFLDATCDVASVNVLPVRCLNVRGLGVLEDGYVWLPIDNDVYKKLSMIQVVIDGNGRFDGVEETVFKDYAAYNERLILEESGGVIGYVNNYTGDKKNIVFEDVFFLNRTDLDQALTRKSRFEISAKYAFKNDTIKFKPMLFDDMEENPFASEERFYFVEFPYPSDTRSIISIELPENYSVESIPESLTLVSEDSSLIFNFQIEVKDKYLNIMSYIKRKENLYSPDVYTALRNMWQLFSDKRNEEIVLIQSPEVVLLNSN